MVLSDLENYLRYQQLHPLFKKAFSFLSASDIASLPDGKNEINGDDLFAIVSHPGNSSGESVKLEAHKRYIDIHYIIKGTEIFGWKEIADCKKPEGAFNDERDYILYNDPEYRTIELRENNFVIVYPEDAHAPGVVTNELHKIVLKIKL